MNFLRHLKPVISINRNYLKLSQRFYYEQTRSGSMEMENKKMKEWNEMSEIDRIKRLAKLYKKDFKWSWDNLKDDTVGNFRSDNKMVSFDENEIIKVWDFDQRNTERVSSFILEHKIDKLNDMNNWQVTCDADYDIGFSKCSWTVSPSGHALFSGYLDTTLPNDGRTVKTGYAYLSSFKSRKPFYFASSDTIFEEFTHLVMRVRGDGRRYFVLFDTSENFDYTWFDRYQFMLYTHGGPYWQFVKIPLNRFFFQYQGFVQDDQYVFNPALVRCLGILAYDPFSGPFSLEIDYIGFLYDSQYNDTTEYEGYYHEVASLKTLGGI